LRFLDKLVATC